MNIPGGIDCPGAELVHRVFEPAPRPSTLVVVNCAGRTRSIIGAQSLINAGVPNRVVALKNGTMGWTSPGFELERGQTRHGAAARCGSAPKARAAAQRVAARFGVHKRSTARRCAMVQGRGATARSICSTCAAPRSTRRPSAGRATAPGGQLVQATDAYVGTRNARHRAGRRRRRARPHDRVVAAADGLAGGVRARGARDGSTRELGTGTGRSPRRSDSAQAETIDAAELKKAAGPRRGRGGRPRDQPRATATATFPARGGRCARGSGSAGRGCRAASRSCSRRPTACSRGSPREATAVLGAPVSVLDGGTRAWRTRASRWRPAPHGC